MKMTNGYEKSIDKTYLTVDEAFQVITTTNKPTKQITNTSCSTITTVDSLSSKLFQTHSSLNFFQLPNQSK